MCCKDPSSEEFFFQFYLLTSHKMFNSNFRFVRNLWTLTEFSSIRMLTMLYLWVNTKNKLSLSVPEKCDYTKYLQLHPSLHGSCGSVQFRRLRVN